MGDRSDKWSRVRIQLARLIDDHYERGEISYRALAEVLGVDSRSVRRWIDGTHRPAVETQEAIEQWLAEQRERIKRNKTRSSQGK